MNKAALPVITVLTLLGHVASERRKYIRVSSEVQIVLSENLEYNSPKFTFLLTFLQTEGILMKG